MDGEEEDIYNGEEEDSYIEMHSSSKVPDVMQIIKEESTANTNVTRREEEPVCYSI